MQYTYSSCLKDLLELLILYHELIHTVGTARAPGGQLLHAHAIATSSGRRRRIHIDVCPTRPVALHALLLLLKLLELLQLLKLLLLLLLQSRRGGVLGNCGLIGLKLLLLLKKVRRQVCRLATRIKATSPHTRGRLIIPTATHGTLRGGHRSRRWMKHCHSRVAGRNHHWGSVC